MPFEKDLKLRILQVATSNSGGAGIAATRLAHLLSKHGFQTKLITRETIESRGFPKRNNWRNFLGKFLTFFQSKILAPGYDLVTPISVGQKVVDVIKSYNPDVIHIHNWYNLLSLDEIVELGKTFPIVFTLHDERLMTGGCHITLSCEKFKSGCKECPAVEFGKRIIARSFNDSRNAFPKVQRLGIIAPSNWLIDSAMHAPVLGTVTNFRVIPNVISTDSQALQIPEVRSQRESLDLLFVASDLSAKVKGLDIAVQAVNLFSLAPNTDLKINFKVVGANLPKDLVLAPSIHFEYYSYLSEVKLRNLFRNADVLLVTSRSENSPNIIAEAQFNGLVVIATDVGGIPEIIDHGSTGFLADASAEGIAKSISEYVGSNPRDIRSLAFDNAKSRWNSVQILDSHLDFYAKVAGS